jgi:hypothetical protein
MTLYTPKFVKLYYYNLFKTSYWFLHIKHFMIFIAITGISRIMFSFAIRL